jgi:superfamily I DNA and/or RNA helicase
LNIEEHLILLKGEDRTEAIEKCIYVNGKVQVVFKNSTQIFEYNPVNVKWLKDPVSYDTATTVVYKDKQPLSGVKRILDFREFIRIGYIKGYHKVYPRKELTIEQSCLKNSDARNVFKYLQQLATLMKINDEEQEGFVSKQYEKISFISPNSVLADYLNPVILIKSRKDKKMPIFPFGFNLSQKEATEKALTEKISVIEGPPGTGKTQTILNIIANAIIEGKTVAVVSNNNTATANVLEKLQNYGLDFIASYLGKLENKRKFFSEQTGLYPEMNSWVLDASDYSNYQQKLIEIGQKLKKMLEVKNLLAQTKQELAALATEKEYFYKYLSETGNIYITYQSLLRHNSKDILSFWLDYQQRIEEKGVISLFDKLKYLLRYGITSFSFYNHSSEQIISLLQKFFYEKREKELQNTINKLSKQLENYRFEENMREYSRISMLLFKARLSRRYSQQKVRKIFADDALWKDFNSFINEYPVILSTTYSLRNCAPPNYLFDYLIIDEASQVDIVTGALAFSSARNAVIVGDRKQLPNVVPEELARKTNKVFSQYHLPKAYNFAQNSMLSSIVDLFNDISKTLLREHYRCHPKIIGFCNSKFYNGELIVLTEDKGEGTPLVVYKTAPGNHARGRYNQRQIDVILEEVLPQQIGKDCSEKVGIISPFRLQAEKIVNVLRNEIIEIDTVHKYQGREKDTIILTTVVNDINDFVDNPNLINVAISRAVNKLIVVTSDNDKNRSSNLDDLVRYIEYNNFEVVQSHIYSVFDLLYHRYSEQLLAIKKKRKRVSALESENLMNYVIEKVLGEPEFQDLDRVMHQPLRMLIRNPEKLSDEECKYAMNVLTHMDFLIFNKVDKRPILVVEVDGYAYHENNPTQLKRDEMKDSILNKYGIQILRIKTNESGEEERLRQKLRQILSNNIHMDAI